MLAVPQPVSRTLLVLLKPLYVPVEVPDASQKLDGKVASVGPNDAQRHHRMNFPTLGSPENGFSGLI